MSLPYGIQLGAGVELGAGVGLGAGLPATVPGSPTIGTATKTGSTTATVAYTAPASNGGSAITRYTAISSPGNITGVLNQAGSGTITITGLNPGTSYTFTVTATNAIGTSSPSAASNSITTDTTVPGAPIIGFAVATGSTTANVPYSAPASNGGSTILSYVATSSPGNITATLTQAGSGTIPVTGLSQGTSYTFTVKATNSVGNSSPSSASNQITTSASVPGAPTIGTATTTGGTTATVAYTAPASNGGSTILSYTATSTPGNITATLTQAGSGTINVTGLTPNTNYTFTVKATNSVGNSSPSSASNQITSGPTVAGAPTGVVALTTGATTAEVTFTAPASNGGATITTYTAISTPGNITASLSQAGSGTINMTGLTVGTQYTFKVRATNSAGNSAYSGNSNYITTTATPTISQTSFVTPGTYLWKVPTGVTSVCVVCVGGGGSSTGGNLTSGGGGGGALGYKNNIAVTPGQTYTVVVGAGGNGNNNITIETDGGDSYFIDSTTVKGGGGLHSQYNGANSGSATFVGDGGGGGGIGVGYPSFGGGGAGGYSGAGGTSGLEVGFLPVTGSGGGGGGAYRQQGGGVGIYAKGADGTVTYRTYNPTFGWVYYAGGPGSATGIGATTYYGYGAAGAAATIGGGGAVRIIWGAGRAYPATNTGDL
jgi:hypothetical protein